MANIQLVVFDMAGTTVSDRGNVAASFIDACKKYGYSVHEADVNQVMGFRKKEAIKMLLKKFYPELENNFDETVERIHDSFISNMVSFYETDTDLRPLPHAEEVFAILQQRKIKVALNTGFTKSITTTIMRRIGWNKTDLIDHIISSDEVTEGRPHPYMIKTIMEVLAIDDVKRVAKVGDTQVDVQEGRNAGCGLVVSVTTGAYTREQLEQYHPDFIIDSLKELPGLIQ